MGADKSDGDAPRQADREDVAGQGKTGEGGGGSGRGTRNEGEGNEAHPR